MSLKLLLWIMIGYVSLVMAQTEPSALSNTILGSQQGVIFVSVEEVFGYAQIVSDQPYEVIQNFNVQSYDKAQNEAGRMCIRFVDDTSIRITEHSMVVIDEFVFDPNPDNSKLALNFVKGTARFTSSSVSYTHLRAHET